MWCRRRSAPRGGSRTASPPASSRRREWPADTSDFLVGEAAFLREAKQHGVRGHELDPGMQAGNEVGANLRTVAAEMIHELLHHPVQRVVALPEHSAARTQGIHVG